MSEQIPEFENPPVSEVAISIAFTQLANWKSPYAGVYWNAIIDDYPKVEIKPPLLTQVEKFGSEFWSDPVRLNAINLEAFYDLNRVWFIGKRPTDLIQLQRDRFIINWRKVVGDEVYPRYKRDLRPRFEREWARFKEFADKSDLGEIEVQQCEITYVNDLIRGIDWNDISDVSKSICQWTNGRSGHFLPQEMETFGMSGSYAMPAERGRLRFSVQHLLREIDRKEVIQIQLVARGRPSSNSDHDLLNWLDLGREWIVRGFTDLTTPDAHKRWRRKI